jgi:hypothetical protein
MREVYSGVCVSTNLSDAFQFTDPLSQLIFSVDPKYSFHLGSPTESGINIRVNTINSNAEILIQASKDICVDLKVNMDEVNIHGHDKKSTSVTVTIYHLKLL